MEALEAQVQEAREGELALSHGASKLEAELTESQSSLAYITTKLHATEASRNETERRLQEAYARLKASESALTLFKDKVMSCCISPTIH